MIDALVQNGFWIDPKFLSEAEVEDVELEFSELKGASAFKRAGVGNSVQVHDDVRRDYVHWLDLSNPTRTQNSLVQKLSSLKEQINRELYLGLWDVEGHYSIYLPGGFYQRHLDRFQNDDTRTLSLVVYLNCKWSLKDGGELILYRSPADQTGFLVEPRAGTMVCFLSERIEHEVRKANFERHSFAGWFRKRTAV